MIGRIISHYKILDKLGEGGMGVVYKAEDLNLGRAVALKFLPPDMTRDPAATERLVCEARAAAALNHPNICTVHEIEVAAEQAFLAMEYVEGESLECLLVSGQLELDDGLDIAVQVADGLAAAHERGITHRDIKPANILVTRKGRAKIMDFGLARTSRGTRHTKAGMIVGTPAYMSPEQVLGESIDQRTDIWSLGVVLYEMVSGERPFKGDRDRAVFYSILNTEPAAVSVARPEVPAALDDVIARTLAKSPDGRQRSAIELAAELRVLRNGPVPTLRTRPIRSSAARSSIAVLPFTDMSPERDQEYFCDGMTEEIINALTNVERLRVSARTSAFQFKGAGHDIRDIGRKLGVETLLEGSVRKAGARLRITVQLVSVADGYDLWSERFDRRMEDVFAIQEEISLAVLDRLKVRLLGDDRTRLIRRRTENLEVYNLYLRARWLWNTRTDEGLRGAIGCFERAIELSPTYALAYAGMADAYNDLMNYSLSPPPDGYRRAKEAALKAIELDDGLAEAHAALGFIISEQEWSWDDAEHEFKRAISLNPGCAVALHGYGLLMAYMGRFDEGMEAMQRALELDPLSPGINRNAAFVLEAAGRYDEALETAKRTAEMDQDYPLLHLMTGIIYLGKSMPAEALAEFELEEQAFGERTRTLEAWVACALALSGETQRAESTLESLKKAHARGQTSAVNVAQVCFVLGMMNEGFEWLAKAYDDHDRWLRLVRRFRRPYLAGDDPRLDSLLSRLGLKR
jgi:serine/threonine protein kinase/tetratricopeptide (TPR) repeat protein